MSQRLPSPQCRLETAIASMPIRDCHCLMPILQFATQHLRMIGCDFMCSFVIMLLACFEYSILEAHLLEKLLPFRSNLPFGSSLCASVPQHKAMPHQSFGAPMQSHARQSSSKTMACTHSSGLPSVAWLHGIDPQGFTPVHSFCFAESGSDTCGRTTQSRPAATPSSQHGWL